MKNDLLRFSVWRNRVGLLQPPFQGRPCCVDRQAVEGEYAFSRAGMPDGGCLRVGLRKARLVAVTLTEKSMIPARKPVPATVLLHREVELVVRVLRGVLFRLVRSDGPGWVGGPTAGRPDRQLTSMTDDFSKPHPGPWFRRGCDKPARRLYFSRQSGAHECHRSTRLINQIIIQLAFLAFRQSPAKPADATRLCARPSVTLTAPSQPVGGRMSRQK